MVLAEKKIKRKLDPRGLGAGWSGRNEEKQLKYLQGVLQRCWFLMMFYCLFRRPDERLERDDDDDDFFN